MKPKINNNASFFEDKWKVIRANPCFVVNGGETEDDDEDEKQVSGKPQNILSLERILKTTLTKKA